MPLSPKQRKIFNFIKTFTDTEGCPPSIREIGEACDISSTSVVNYNLGKLEDLQLIERTFRRARGIKILNRFDLEPYEHDSPLIT